MWGVANAGFNPTAQLGTVNYSGAWYGGGSPTFTSSGFTIGYNITTTPVVNDVMALAIDFTAGKIWIAKNGVWYGSSDPATGTLPAMTFIPATVGALFPAMCLYSATDGAWTLQAGAASQKYAPPASFSAWDGGVAPPPTSVWSSTDASANGMTLSNGGLTVTPGTVYGTSIRSSASKTSGKLYVEFSTSAALSSPAMRIGLASAGFDVTGALGDVNYSFGWQLPGGFNFVSTGFTTGATPYYGSIAANDVLSIAIDFAAQKIWIGYNNSWAAGNPGTGLGAHFTFVSATVGALFPSLSFGGVGSGVWTLQSTAACRIRPAIRIQPMGIGGSQTPKAALPLSGRPK